MCQNFKYNLKGMKYYINFIIIIFKVILVIISVDHIKFLQ